MDIEKLKDIQIKCRCGQAMTENYLRIGSSSFLRELNCRHCGERLIIERGMVEWATLLDFYGFYDNNRSKRTNQ